MPETVAILHDQEIIRVHSYGAVGEDEITVTLGQVSTYLRETGFSRVLVDARDLLSLPPTSVLYEFVETFSLAGIPRATMFAIVGNKHLENEFRFMETVAVNRGVAMLLFSTVEKAKNWLGVGKSREAL